MTWECQFTVKYSANPEANQAKCAASCVFTIPKGTYQRTTFTAHISANTWKIVQERVDTFYLDCVDEIKRIKAQYEEIMKVPNNVVKTIVIE